MVSVAVIGAGIAGLTAAYRLTGLGMDVTVMEASGRVGGRMTTDLSGGYLIDRGAQFLSDGYPVIGKLIDELGLSQNLYRASGWNGIVRGGKVSRFIARSPLTLLSSGLLKWRDVLHVAYGTFALAAKSGKLPLNDYSAWNAYDDAEAATWIAGSFGREALEYLFEPMLEGFYFQVPERMSRAWPAIVWSFGARGKRAMALAEGIGSLPEALARNVNICLSTPVESVETIGSAVRINTPGRMLNVDYAVIATTATVAGTLYVPATDIERRLLGTGYSASINISLALPGGIPDVKENSSDIYGLLVPRLERKTIAAVAIESRKCRRYVPKGELLNVMLSNAAAGRLMDEPEENVLAEVLPELQGYFPGIESNVEFTRFHRWREAEPRSPVGRSRDMHLYRSSWHPSMRVILAGDYMSIPCTEGAAESGQWAAARLAKSAARL
jgi:oxygen-dependent protoporphyrinogen oxidase